MQHNNTDLSGTFRISFTHFQNGLNRFHHCIDIHLPSLENVSAAVIAHYTRTPANLMHHSIMRNHESINSVLFCLEHLVHHHCTKCITIKLTLVTKQNKKIFYLLLYMHFSKVFGHCCRDTLFFFVGKKEHSRIVIHALSGPWSSSSSSPLFCTEMSRETLSV